MKLLKVGVRSAAFALLLATALQSTVARAYDARSPFGMYGRDDWHSPDRNWDGSQTSPGAVITPPAAARSASRVIPAVIRVKPVVAAPNSPPRCCLPPQPAAVVLPVGDEILARNQTTSLGKSEAAAALLNSVATGEAGNGVALINSLLDMTNQTVNLTVSKVLTAH